MTTTTLRHAYIRRFTDEKIKVNDKIESSSAVGSKVNEELFTPPVDRGVWGQ